MYILRRHAACQVSGSQNLKLPTELEGHGYSIAKTAAQILSKVSSNEELFTDIVFCKGFSGYIGGILSRMENEGYAILPPSSSHFLRRYDLNWIKGPKNIHIGMRPTLIGGDPYILTLYQASPQEQVGTGISVSACMSHALESGPPQQTYYHPEDIFVFGAPSASC